METIPMQKRTVKSRMCAAAAVLAVLALAGCGPRVYSGGNKPLAEKLAQIKPGSQTRSQVRELLGTPSTRSLYGQEVWFYISSTQETTAFFEPDETERTIYAVSFDEQGLVQGLSQLNKDDGKEIVISGKKTPTAGHNMSVVEQMVGNIGRFNSDLATSQKGK
jgi:outer membrane protein assembly factor BamE (lipoprotein component of BamABCDE complex)